jgi:cytochrome c556
MHTMTQAASFPRGLAAAISLAVLAAPLAVHADQAPKSKAERTIEYRQAALTLLGWNIGPIAGMVKGEIPWDQKALEMHAMRLAQVAPMIAEGFPADAQAGAPTDAKPEIWKNMDDFKAKARDLEAATAKFAETAKGGDRKAIAAGLGEVGGTCKACHEKYRAD